MGATAYLDGATNEAGVCWVGALGGSVVVLSYSLGHTVLQPCG